MEQPKTVSMTSVTLHTFDAIEREPGTVYEVEEQYADTLIALNFARRTEHLVDRGGKKKAAAPARETSATAVSPMTTQDFPTHKG